METTALPLIADGFGQSAGAMSPLAIFKLMSAVFGVNFRLLLILFLVVIVFLCIVFWKLFVKANYKGYEALISGHNGYMMIIMSGKQGRYFFLFLIPIVLMQTPVYLGLINPATIKIFSIIGFLIFVYLYIDVTLALMKKFSKEIWFSIGTILFPYIFYPILAFGKATYKK